MITTLNALTLPKAYIDTHEIVQVTDKLYQFAMRYFTLSQSLFFCGYGTKELSVDACRLSLDTEFDRATASPVHMGNFSIVHGLFFICTGICGLGLAAHQMSYADLSPISLHLDWGCKAFFLMANLVALDYNISIIHRTLQLGSSIQEKALAWSLQKSAIAGIMSSLSYLAATAWTLLGGSTAMALVIGIIGACFGSYKILYDFFLLQKEVAAAGMVKMLA